jgi:hypothetical protein
MEDFASKYEREFSLVTLISSVSSREFGGDIRWIVDSGVLNLYAAARAILLEDG